MNKSTAWNLRMTWLFVGLLAGFALSAIIVTVAASDDGVNDFERRVAERDACLAVGGTYHEWTKDIFNNVASRCDLSTEED